MVMIQWYPGHMEKARRDMLQAIQVVDLIVEIRDARIPDASRNPLLDQMGQGKPRLILLSKADLADAAWTARWAEVLKRNDCMVKAMNLAHDPHVKKEVLAMLHRLGEAKIARMKRRGICPRPLYPQCRQIDIDQSYQRKKQCAYGKPSGRYACSCLDSCRSDNGFTGYTRCSLATF